MPTAHWLVKSEPIKYSFAQLQKDKSTTWDGVRNFEARNNLRAMKSGDLVFFYHSNEGKEIVGIARVKREAYQDPTTDEDWSVVDLEPISPMNTPVPLSAIKETPELAEMQMVKKGRISVTKVAKAEFDLILKMGKTKLARA